MDDPFGGREIVVLAPSFFFYDDDGINGSTYSDPSRIVFLSFYFCSSCCTTLSLSLSLGDERVRE